MIDMIMKSFFAALKIEPLEFQRGFNEIVTAIKSYDERLARIELALGIGKGVDDPRPIPGLSPAGHGPVFAGGDRAASGDLGTDTARSPASP